MDPKNRFGGGESSFATLVAGLSSVGLVLSVVVPSVSPAAWASLAGGALAAWLATSRAVHRIRLRPDRLPRAGEPTLVVGDADDVARVVQQLAHHPETGARPVATAGWVGDVPTLLPHEDGADLVGTIARRRVGHVVIASATWVEAASELFGSERPDGVRISIAPRSGVTHRETQVVEVCGVPYLSIDPRTDDSRAVATCSSSRAGAPVGVEAGRYVEHVESGLEPASEPADVSIVIVTHESANDIAPCLASIDAIGDEARCEVIVVDNASTDGTADLVTAHPDVRLIRKRGRHGFSLNVNVGFAASRGRHVLLLNPDTVVEDGVMDALVGHLDRHPEVGAVAPRLRYPDGRPQANARRYPSPLTTVVRRTPLRRLLPDRADAHLVDTEFEGARDIDWCLGAALLVRASALHQLRGLDDGYRLYCEDIDLCWRLRQGGWLVQQLSAPVVTHALGEMTSKRFVTRQTLWHLRSVLRFARLHRLRPARSSVPAAGVIDLATEDVIDLRDMAGVEQ